MMDLREKNREELEQLIHTLADANNENANLVLKQKSQIHSYIDERRGIHAAFEAKYAEQINYYKHQVEEKDKALLKFIKEVNKQLDTMQKGLFVYRPSKKGSDDLIDMWDFSVRLSNALTGNNIKRYGDIFRLTEDEMLRGMPNFGRVSLNELKDHLKKKFPKRFIGDERRDVSL